MTTVTRDDLVHPWGPWRLPPVTTAHVHLARFYREAERQRRLSWVERIAAAPSPFALDGLLADFALFGSRDASSKTRSLVAEVARVQRCVLAGVLP